MLFALLLVASMQDQAPNPSPVDELPPALDVAPTDTPPPVVTDPPAPASAASPAPTSTSTPADPPAAVVVPATPEAIRMDATIRAAFGGVIGTGVGWALGIATLAAFGSTLSSAGTAGGVVLVGLFVGSPIAIGGLGSFFGALAATRDPATSLFAGAGAAAGVTVTLLLGGLVFAAQPSGDCGPSSQQLLVAGFTVLATPVAGAMGGAAGAYLGTSGAVE